MRISANTPKDPDAVSLGRRGGRVGGPARALALTAQQRSDIARKAAVTRWGGKIEEEKSYVELARKEASEIASELQNCAIHMEVLRLRKKMLEHFIWLYKDIE